MSEILFLCHRPPFPPDRGDKIRAHHLLLELARLAPVHVGCLEDEAGGAALELGHIAASHHIAPRRSGLLRAGLTALREGRPVSETLFDSGALREWIGRTLASRPVDTIVAFSGQMGQFVPREWPGRLIVDLCDVDSAKFDAYARDSWFARPVHAREARLLRKVEAGLVRRADATLLVSDEEAALLRARVGPGGRIEALGNGIDTGRFDPDRCDPHPRLRVGGPHLVFTGQMDYPPNVAACERTIERLLPPIRERHPDAVFHIVGRAPVRALRQHDGRAGVRVWGEVPDTRPFLAGAHAVLAPLTIARGVQNKVLEAMAMARPVVASREAATGIDAEHGRDLMVARDDAAFVDRVLAVLDDGDALGLRARRRVVETHGWATKLAPLAGLVGRASPQPVSHAA